MKVTLSFELREDDNLERVLDQAKRKIENQAHRTPVLCTHDESDDLVYDINGNRCGTINVLPEWQP